MEDWIYLLPAVIWLILSIIKAVKKEQKRLNNQIPRNAPVKTINTFDGEVARGFENVKTINTFDGKVENSFEDDGASDFGDNTISGLESRRALKANILSDEIVDRLNANGERELLLEREVLEPVKETQSKRQGKKIPQRRMDKKNLVVYSEIMQPKFKD